MQVSENEKKNKARPLPSMSSQSTPQEANPKLSTRVQVLASPKLLHIQTIFEEYVTVSSGSPISGVPNPWAEDWYQSVAC